MVALLVFAVWNYYQVNGLLVQANQTKNSIISDEIRGILEFQDVAMESIENPLDIKLKDFSRRLIEDYFPETDDLESSDLYKIREELGMDAEKSDIYIINRNGIIVNTTFEQDKNLNLFSFGDALKQHLLGIFNSNEFTPESFTLEGNTGMLRKYVYQSTLDSKYIIQLGEYSDDANKVANAIRQRLNEISSKQPSVSQVDLFLDESNPFSLNNDVDLDEEEKDILMSIFEKKQSFVREVKNEGIAMRYEYTYMARKNTDLYKSAVIRIISDRTNEVKLLRNKLMLSLLFSGLTILIVIFVIFNKTQVITSPIKKLVDNVTRITNGHLNERALVEGNNEITTLSQKFNLMLERLEKSYNELEQKVIERTAKISKQKEEIESQRDNLAEQNNRLESAYMKIEEQNKHITDSIHYAKRIQNTILPPDDFIERILPESFILYRPKDIVSGDFYWAAEQDNRAIIAAVDCTGHGVPGAFMSIVGNNQLNYSVSVKNARNANEILDELNKGVTHSLRQTNEGSAVKDGMDIALIMVDYDNMKLQFAGAFNPLYFIRNGELTITKGNKFPIGAFVGEELQKFDNHEFDVKKGDIVYIFSDGYADQFGGDRGKKFKYRRFHDLLLEIHNEPMARQRDILNETIVEWMGELEQIDDILVIGVKI